MKIASLKPTQWFPGQNVSVKPHLRGWIHLVAAPLSLAASIVLTCLAPTGATKGGSAIYLAASLILFGSDNLVHRLGRGTPGDLAQPVLANRTALAGNTDLRRSGMGCSLVSATVLVLGWRCDRVVASCRRNFVHNRRSSLRDKEARPFTALVWLP